MPGTIFWDVDTQYDFMHADGKLYVPDAEQVIPNLKRLTDHAHRAGIRIVASADDHVAGHRELSEAPDYRETFPPHCMHGTPGQAKIPETALTSPTVIEPDATGVSVPAGDILFNKHWFDVFTNLNVEPLVRQLDPDRIYVYGVALDVCNRYAIEGLLGRRPNTKIFAVTDATKPIDATRVQGLLDDWRRRGVTTVTTDQVITQTSRLA
ncbi:MAG: cysteine hydrolase [Gemmatimonadetes bacterium]|nr:cysteine hydrolase [Gemmatimonadota bacterium]